jgi:protein-tyrosine-phosphatase
MFVCGGGVLISVLCEGEFSKLSPKKINVDSGGKVSIFRSDIIGHCGTKMFI